jgi:hypothetical protein
MGTTITCRWPKFTASPRAKLAAACSASDGHESVARELTVALLSFVYYGGGIDALLAG